MMGKMMKQIKWPLVVGLILLNTLGMGGPFGEVKSASALPATKGARKIAVLKLGYIMQHAKAPVYVFKFLEERRKLYRDQMMEDENKLREAHKQLQEEQNQIIPEALKNSLAELDRTLQHRKDELAFIDSKAMEIIHKKILEITRVLREKQNIDAIFPGESLVDYDNSLDITDEVLRQLNEMLPTIDVDRILEDFKTLKESQSS